MHCRHFSLRFKMADSGQDSAPVILPVSPANTSPATHEVHNLIADNTDIVGKIIHGMDSALSGLFRGKYSECLPSSAVTRGEESLALVCSSGFSPISKDSSSHKQPLTSLRIRAFSGSGSPPRLSTPKRVSSCKLFPFHGKLIPLLPSEMLLLKDVANQSIFSLLEKPKRARSLSPKRLSKSTYKIPKVAPKKKPPPPGSSSGRASDIRRGRGSRILFGIRVWCPWRVGWWLLGLWFRFWWKRETR